MTEEKWHEPLNTMPSSYGIWAKTRPDGPLHGRSGFLSECGRRLVFRSHEDAERKCQDLQTLCLNRHPIAVYKCVERPEERELESDIRAEELKAHDLKPDFHPMRYEITQRSYGNTGGGCMVGTLAVRLTELDKSIWVNCNEEGIAITSADCIWNEDHSESWTRYADVTMLTIDFWDDSPEEMGPLLPAIHEALVYTIEQETVHSQKLFSLPAKWLPEVYRQNADPEYLKWAEAEDRAVEIGEEGVIMNDPAHQRGTHRPANGMEMTMGQC